MAIVTSPAALLELKITSACDRARTIVDALPHDELLGRPLDELAEEIVDECVPQLIELKPDEKRGRPGDAIFEMRQGMLSAKTVRTPAVAVFVDIPFRGTRDLFSHQPSSTFAPRPPFEVSKADDPDGDYLTLTIAGTSMQHPEAKQALDAQLHQLTTWVQAVNDDITKAANRIRAEAGSALTSRRARLEQAGVVLEALNIPAHKIPPDQALEIPAERQTVTLTSTPPNGAAEQEWTLSNAIYEQIISTIMRATTTLERLPRTAPLLAPKEEAIRDVLLVLLNGAYDDGAGSELFIGGEVLNGKGKTDILVRHRDRNVFIGECKFWTGASAFTKAIDQLLGYTVWRDTKAALVLFIKATNTTGHPRQS